MKNVNVKIVTKPTSFPVGTKGGDYVYLMGNMGETSHTSKLISPTTSATFVNVKPGDYWIEGARLSVDNEDIIGERARVEFRVGDDTILIETADAIGVTLSDV